MNHINKLRTLLLILTTLSIASCGTDKKENTATAINVADTAQQDPMSKSLYRGKDIYSELCISCHLPSGKGVPGSFPPLNPSDWLTNKRKESIHALKYGLKGEITVNGQKYDNIMLPLGLEDQEVADVLNYCIQTWNEGAMVTVEEVSGVEK